MLYAVLCYTDEKAVMAWSKEEDDACLARLALVEDGKREKGLLGPVVRLNPTLSATTLHKANGTTMLLDGPFAETKEQLLGFFMVECDTIEEAVEFARDLAKANPGQGAYEIRPTSIYKPSALKA